MQVIPIARQCKDISSNILEKLMASLFLVGLRIGSIVKLQARIQNNMLIAIPFWLVNDLSAILMVTAVVRPNRQYDFAVCFVFLRSKKTLNSLKKIV